MTKVERGSSTSTLRHRLREELLLGFAGARQLSQALGVTEKDIAHHIEHLERSIRHQGERVETLPASCVSCGFVFRKRQRLTRPSGCPVCHGERIEPPMFRVVAMGPRPRKTRAVAGLAVEEADLERWAS